MANTVKTILTIKTSKGRVLFVDQIEPFDWSSRAGRAASFDHMTNDEIKNYISNINNFKFLNDGESFTFSIQKITVSIDEEDYTPEDILIKTALNRLSEQEIIALGIEDLGVYHKLKEHDKEFSKGSEPLEPFYTGYFSNPLKATKSTKVSNLHYIPDDPTPPTPMEIHFDHACTDLVEEFNNCSDSDIGEEEVDECCYDDCEEKECVDSIGSLIEQQIINNISDNTK